MVAALGVMVLLVCSEDSTAFSTRRTALSNPSSATKKLHPQFASSTSSLLILYSEDGNYEADVPVPPPPTPNPPPPVPPKRLDPLMASLTRLDPESADVPTKNVPFLGEIPVDGSLALLIPAAGIAVIGFILSIVIAVRSSDEIVGLLSQVSSDINQAAVSKSSQVYDDGACRGICSSQQQDLEGLKSFMEGLKK